MLRRTKKKREAEALAKKEAKERARFEKYKIPDFNFEDVPEETLDREMGIRVKKVSISDSDIEAFISKASFNELNF